MSVGRDMKTQHTQKGFAFIGALIGAIALAVVATALFTSTSGTRQEKMQDIKMIKQLGAQAMLLRERVVDCAIQYPNDADAPADDASHYPSQSVPLRDVNGTPTANSNGGMNAEYLECSGARVLYCPDADDRTPCVQARLFANDADSILHENFEGAGKWTYFNNNNGAYIRLDFTDNTDDSALVSETYDFLSKSLGNGELFGCNIRETSNGQAYIPVFNFNDRDTLGNDCQ